MVPANLKLPSKIRTRKQAKSDRVALRKLKSTGLYKGKVDLRRAPTRYQKAALEKYRDVIKGRAVVLKPAKPRSYAKTFRVVGDKVIVPRRKGERVKIKAGKIEVQRKIGRGKRKGQYVKLADAKAGAGKIYYLPLERSYGVQWYKFDSKEELDKFVFEVSPTVGATFKNFADYVLEIDAHNEERADDDEEWLDDQLIRKIRARKRVRLRSRELRRVKPARQGRAKSRRSRRK